MDAEREAREIARASFGEPEGEADRFAEQELTDAIAAALRRAHAAGRREAVEECAGRRGRGGQNEG